MNLFSFILPSSGEEVHFRLSTGKDETEIAKMIEGKKKLGSQIENNVSNKLLQCIVSINGETDKQKLSQKIKNMRAMDSRALRKYMEEIEPGIDMDQKVLCPHCDAESEVSMPLGINFFWPDM